MSNQTAGEEFANLDTGEPLCGVRNRVASANAYLGSAGIVEGLARGAGIVITGRVADVSSTVGPAVYEFGWSADDWDMLATATVAGHLIECGAQVSGGMFFDWSEELVLANVGYPLAELCEDGSLIITKAEGPDGEVSIGTVTEQLIYEIGDPAHYLTPDVDADFSQITVREEGVDRVGVRGRPRKSGIPAVQGLPRVYRRLHRLWDVGYRRSGCGKKGESMCRDDLLTCLASRF